MQILYNPVRWTIASLVECCFTSTETVDLLGTGALDVHLDFHTASGHRIVDDYVELNVLRCRVDILGTKCDQCVCMVQRCFTSTETIRLIRTGSPGRPPRLSHSSWTLTIAYLSPALLCSLSVCIFHWAVCPSPSPPSSASSPLPASSDIQIRTYLPVEHHMPQSDPITFPVCLSLALI